MYYPKLIQLTRKAKPKTILLVQTIDRAYGKDSSIYLLAIILLFIITVLLNYLLFILCYYIFFIFYFTTVQY